MCCKTDSFCCTDDMKKGIIYAGFIDVILLITLVVVNIVLQQNYFSLWFVVVIIADLLLIIGSYKSATGLLMVWMVIGMINIVLLFLGWIGYALYGLLVVFVATVCNPDFHQNFNHLEDHHHNLDVDCKGTDTKLIANFATNAIFIYGLPIYYVYLWVVVKSHREELMVSNKSNVHPMTPMA